MAAAPSPTSSSSRVSMDRCSVDSATGEPVELPAPLHRVTPKVWYLPNRGVKVLWLDFVFRSGEAMELFERASQEALSGAASFFRLPSSRPNAHFTCFRITSEFKEWRNVFAVVFEHYPDLAPYLGKKMKKQGLG